MIDTISEVGTRSFQFQSNQAMKDAMMSSLNHLASKVICKSILITGTFFLTGCVSAFAPPPPTIPQSSDVVAYLKQVNQLTTMASISSNPPTSQPTLVEITEAGYNLVDINCNNFFNALDKDANDAEFNRQEVTLGGALAAGTLAAAKASAASIAITALAGTFLGASIDNYQNTALFKQYSNQTHQLVTKALASYLALSPPDSNKITDIYISTYYVNGYAEICTYAGIEDLVSQAIQKAQTGDLTTQSNPPQTANSTPTPPSSQQSPGSRGSNGQQGHLGIGPTGVQLSPQEQTSAPQSESPAPSAFTRPDIGVIQQ